MGANKDDIIIGDDSSENLIGGAGDDFIDGNGGDDKLIGGSGDDTLIGGDGDDKLIGGSGADILTGGSGDDTVNGGSGDDTAIYVLGLNESSSDLYKGGSGFDILAIELTEDELLQLDLLAILNFFEMNKDSGVDFSSFGFGLFATQFEELQFSLEGEGSIFINTPNNQNFDGDPTVIDVLDSTSDTQGIDIDLDGGIMVGTGTGTDTFNDIDDFRLGSGDDTFLANADLGVPDAEVAIDFGAGDNALTLDMGGAPKDGTYVVTGDSENVTTNIVNLDPGTVMTLNFRDTGGTVSQNELMNLNYNFTLIELMIVVAIVQIIATVIGGIFNFNSLADDDRLFTLLGIDSEVNLNDPVNNAIVNIVDSLDADYDITSTMDPDAGARYDDVEVLNLTGQNDELIFTTASIPTAIDGHFIGGALGDDMLDASSLTQGLTYNQSTNLLQDSSTLLFVTGFEDLMLTDQADTVVLNDLSEIDFIDAGASSSDALTVSSLSPAPCVTFNLRTGELTDAMGMATIVGFESITLTSNDDTVILDGNIFSIPGVSLITVDGAGGSDTLDFSSAVLSGAIGITADFGLGTFTHGGVTLNLPNFENIIGSNRSDILTGELGQNNIFESLFGIDLMNGNGSFSVDTAILNSNVAANFFTFNNFGNYRINGPEGSDTIISIELLDFNNTNPLTIVAGTNATNVLTGLNNREDIVVGFEGNDLLRGDDVGQLLVFNASNDVLNGGAGNDTLIGDADILDFLNSGGHDILIGSFGADIIYGDAITLGVGVNNVSSGGSDTIKGGDDNDIIYGDAQTMRGFASTGNDVIDGGAGNDVIYGDGQTIDLTVLGNSTGNDRITGGTGNDNIWGDFDVFMGLGFTIRGADVFVFAPGHGSDTLHDFNSFTLNEKIDLTAFSTDLATVLANTVGPGTTTVIDTSAFGGNVGDQITLINVGAGLLDADDFLL